jgi:DNA-binding Lrp family transcriptional regulator
MLISESEITNSDTEIRGWKELKREYSMKKQSLKDVKMTNRRLIIQLVLTNGSLSRIELAARTGLSPSTVSGIVNDLLSQQILVESGVYVVTGGRSRQELQINPQYGIVAVAEIGRKGAALYVYDMALQSSRKEEIADHYMAGNELLAGITAAIFRAVSGEALHAGKMKGIGLLFQEDMSASDFSVMYSTGFSSATISLREALVTQFHIPVTEEYSQAYTIRHILEKETTDAVENHAHIHIGSRVVVDVTQGGSSLALHDGPCTDVTSLLAQQGEQADIRRLLDTCGHLPQEPTEIRKAEPTLEQLTAMLGRLIAMLSTLFSLDAVFVSGHVAQLAAFAELLTGYTQRLLPPGSCPRIVALKQGDAGTVKMMAGRLRRKVLCENVLA